MEVAISELLDRWSICKLKMERIGDGIKPEFEALDNELRAIEARMPELDWLGMKKFLYDVNDSIWMLESGLRSGRENLFNPHYIFDSKNEPTLKTIGTTAVLIRNFNGLRVSFKNHINHITHQGFSDIKKDHLSEVKWK